MARAKFLHTADLHLSRPFGFLPPQLAEDRRRDQRRTLTRITDLALERDVDIVLLAGDVFDNPDGDPTDVEAFISEIARLHRAGKRTFVIPGNHDSSSRGSVWKHMQHSGLHIFLSPEWQTVVLHGLGVAITGAAFDHAGSERRAFEQFIPSELPTIALLHGSLESPEWQLDKYHPFTAEELISTGVSYAALGHYHRLNIIRDQQGSARACYPGTHEGIALDPVECGDRFVVLGEIGDGGAVSVEPVKVNRRRVKIGEIDCTSFDSEAGLLEAIRTLCEPDALVHVRLTGSPTADLASVFAELPSRFRDSCLYLSIDRSGLTAPVHLPTDERTIRGRYCRHLMRQIDIASDPERKRLLSRALELCLTAFADGGTS